MDASKSVNAQAALSAMLSPVLPYISHLPFSRLRDLLLDRDIAIDRLRFGRITIRLVDENITLPATMTLESHVRVFGSVTRTSSSETWLMLVRPDRWGKMVVNDSGEVDIRYLQKGTQFEQRTIFDTEDSLRDWLQSSNATRKRLAEAIDKVSANFPASPAELG